MTRDEFAIPIVLVSHQIDEVMRLAGQVVMMERGKVREVGAPEDIFASARPGKSLRAFRRRLKPHLHGVRFRRPLRPDPAAPSVG